MKYGLTRLVLIDSYLPGRVYEICLNGHTNILGNNASGKTSLIKLIVMFYGESPLALGIKEVTNSKQLGFTDRYLPRTGSYVIFEYLVNGELRSLIYTANSNNPGKYHRYFAPTGYHLENFWDDGAHSPIDSALWRKQAKVQYAGKLKEVTTDIEHTEVLLGGRDHMYGMGPRQLDMKRMKKLMTSMFHKDAGHTELSKIIEDWINTDLQKKKELLADGIIETAFLQSWVDEYHALSWLKTNREKFDDLHVQLMDYDDASLKQQSYYLAAEAKLAQIEKQKTEASTTHKENQEAINSKILKSQERHASLKADEQKLDSDYRALLAEKSTLDITLATLKQKFPADIKQRIEQAGQQKRILISREEELRKITVKEQSTNENRSAQLESMKHEFSLRKAELKTRISNYETESLKQQNSTKEQSDTKLEQALQPLNRELKKLEAKEEEQKHHKLQIETRLESPSLGKDERQRIIELDHDREKLSDERDALAIEVENLSIKLKKVKAQRKDLYDELVAKQKQQDDYHDELEALDPFLNPHPESFLAFLQSNDLKWADTFGRAMRPEVLHQKNLCPEIIEESPSIFGVSIDSSKLLPNHEVITDVSKLQSRIDELNDNIDTLTTNINQLEKGIGKSDAEIKAIENDNVIWQQKQKNKRDEIKDNKTSIQNEKLRLNELLERRLNEWKNELSLVSEKLLEVSTDRKHIETKIEDVKASLLVELNASLQDIKNQFDLSCNALEKELEELPTAQSEREAEIENAYKNELEAHGIDSEYVTKLQNEINEIKQFRETVKREQDNYEGYQSFLRDSYEPRYSPLLDEIEVADAKLNECTNEIEKLEDEQGNLKIKRSAQAEFHQKRIASFNSESTKLSLILDHGIEISIDAKPVAQETLTTEDIEERFSSAKDAKKGKYKVISDLNDKLRHGFTKSGTGAFKHFYGHPGDKNEATVSARFMTLYFTEGKYQNDLGLFMRDSQQLFKIATYVNYIERFKRKISSFDSKLNEHMSQANEFGAIEDLKVKVNFTYGNDDNWQTIKAIETEYSAWQDVTGGIVSSLSNTEQLPKPSLIEAIERFLSLPNKSDFSVNDLHEHIDFEFSINDQGEEKTVNSLKQINSQKSQISSNGVSHLIVLSIFIGILNMRRSDNIIHFNWSLDELADIDPSNILVLFNMLKQNHIHLISACTVTDDSVYEAFDNVYTITKQGGTKILVKESDEDIFAELEELA
jgi:hypothetical protein